MTAPATMQSQDARPGIPRTFFIAGGLIVLIILAAGIASYLLITGGQVYTDKAQITAPLINLAPATGGTLNRVYVNPGDSVPAGAPVALVGNELVKTQIAGTVASTETNIGELVNPGQAVVTMLDPAALRLVAQVDENKGLSSLRVGDRATFTVDAFGGETFTGVVDEVSPTSHASGVVFNISGERQTQTFDVKIRYDVTAHPELKNGMSARLTVYTGNSQQ
ncbi:MAG: efflux RND transporter periplasmic adaptor subunit [Patescibacteria group bacterium]|nr:efflux RND transporter periplasmic adaptor subunit [Patescibacteria group bacterium]